ncbi:AAA family ATPase [Polynucleobacter paneuropaeus]|jgi:RecA-family ATPase|uniref:AAA family ATPase n=1 Tax=Polynucleobacter paneuropaeus TaxID=2527775 RepID=UPI001BFDA311|nr:AAA family ATPase [Polynucleobacter paneuropaeus]MBT8631637.1 AAA family ATPase [Polynucleobacter paneuropaeus]
MPKKSQLETLTNAAEKGAGLVSPFIETRVDLAQWVDKDPPLREWLIKGFIPMGAVSGLFGQGGIGKSFLCQQIATSLALGKNTFGEIHEGKKYKVLAMFCEDDSHELARRQKGICKMYGVPLADTIENLHLYSFTEVSSYLAKVTAGELVLTKLFEFLEREIEKVDPKCILLDNVGKILAGSKVAEELIGEFITALARLCKDRAILFIGHTGKANEEGKTTEYLGSVAFHNHVRYRSFLEPKDGYVRLSCKKNNYGLTDFTFTAQFNGEAFSIVSDHVVKATKDFHKETELNKGKEAILEFIRAKALENVYLSDKPQASLPLIKSMFNANGASKGLNEAQLKAALSSLMLEGVLVKEKPPNWNQNRNKTEVLMIKEG